MGGKDTITDSRTRSPVFIGGNTFYFNNINNILVEMNNKSIFIIVISKIGKALFYIKYYIEELKLDETITEKTNQITGFWIPGHINGKTVDVMLTKFRIFIK